MKKKFLRLSLGPPPPVILYNIFSCPTVFRRSKWIASLNSGLAAISGRVLDKSTTRRGERLSWLLFPPTAILLVAEARPRYIFETFLYFCKISVFCVPLFFHFVFRRSSKTNSQNSSYQTGNGIRIARQGVKPQIITFNLPCLQLDPVHLMMIPRGIGLLATCPRVSSLRSHKGKSRTLTVGAQRCFIGALL